MFTTITNLEKTLNQLKEMEKEVIKSRYKNVMKELLDNVEEFFDNDTFNSWIQTNTSLRNTHKDSIEKAFWAMGFQYTKWMHTEKVSSNEVFFYTSEGMRCDDKSKMQIVAC